MYIPTIKELMHETAQLTKYQDGKLWYNIAYLTAGNSRSFDFPIDITGEDASGEFGRTEKAITLMRWIRKHIDFLKLVAS